MDLLTYDHECYFDNEYTLTKMTTEAFVRDPRYEFHLASFKFNDEKTFWLLPDRHEKFVREEIDWADTALICHHSHFDGFVLSHHYGVRPALHIDTLSMARVLDGPKAGNLLHDLCIRHSVGTKGDYVTFAKGRHLADFSRDELAQYGAYCCNDADRTYDLATKLLPQMPEDELKLMDLTVRMFTEPVLVGDVEKLRGAVRSERDRKRVLLTELGYECKACGGGGFAVALAGLFDEPSNPAVPCKDCNGTGVDRKPFSSSDKFAAILRSIGVEPATKISPKTGQPIYAFARTDPDMQELLEDPDEVVRALAEARIAVKSTIVETRAQRYADAASRGSMPVYISYGGAHTFRWAGGDSMNWQNLSKHNENRPEMSVIKVSVSAPPGHRTVIVDSGQGEARIVAWNAGQQDLVEAFTQGRDVYSEHATTIYGRPVDRKRVKDDYVPGQLGKVSILGMGFGMGWHKASMELLKGMLGAPPIQFTEQDIATLQVDSSRFLSNPKKIEIVDKMPSRLAMKERLIHCLVTEALVLRYRGRFAQIPRYWTLMEGIINAMITGEEATFGANGCMRTAKDKIWMPNGLALRYDGIERDEHGDATYFDGRTRTKIHGPLLTENTTQCLHRIIVGEQVLKVVDAGIKVALMTHDDVVEVVPEDAAEDALAYTIQVMSTAPAWAAGLPLIGEGKIGMTLLEGR